MAKEITSQEIEKEIFGIRQKIENLTYKLRNFKGDTKKQNKILRSVVSHFRNMEQAFQQLDNLDESSIKVDKDADEETMKKALEVSKMSNNDELDIQITENEIRLSKNTLLETIGSIKPSKTKRVKGGALKKKLTRYINEQKKSKKSKEPKSDFYSKAELRELIKKI